MIQKLVTILFLFSFLIGLLQPVLPLVEYYVFKESIMELFCENRDVVESDCEGTCYLASQLKKNQEKSENPGNLIKFEEVPKSFLTIAPSIFRHITPDDELQNEYSFLHAQKIPHRVFEPPKS